MPPVSSQTDRKQLYTLQAGRAIASLLVVFYHTAVSIFGDSRFWGYDPSRKVFNFGHSGVDFFFVLSGFIILYAHWNDLGKPQKLPTYASKRFCRIYPIYWIILAVIAPVYFLVPALGKGFERSLAVIISSVILIPITSIKSILPVAWTLYHEVLFYCVLAIAIFNRRIGRFVLFGWMTACILALWLGTDFFPLSFLLSPFNLLFGMGMFACWTFRSRQVKAPMTLAIAGTALFFIVGLLEDFLEWPAKNTRHLIFGIACTMAVLGLVELERLGRIAIPSMLKAIGDASYVIYLIHFPVLSIGARVFARSGLSRALPGVVSFILLPSIAVAVGIAVHLFLEKPLLRFLTRLTTSYLNRAGHIKSLNPLVSRAEELPGSSNAL
jgi:peptidoglycan/LPS O-acetylase OafA/YrhL